MLPKNVRNHKNVLFICSFFSSSEVMCVNQLKDVGNLGPKWIKNILRKVEKYFINQGKVGRCGETEAEQHVNL